MISEDKVWENGLSVHLKIFVIVSVYIISQWLRGLSIRSITITVIIIIIVAVAIIAIIVINNRERVLWDVTNHETIFKWNDYLRPIRLSLPSLLSHHYRHLYHRHFHNCHHHFSSHQHQKKLLWQLKCHDLYLFRWKSLPEPCKRQCLRMLPRTRLSRLVNL